METSRTTASKQQARRELTEADEEQRSLREAVRLVRLGEFSKARQALLAAKLAPGTPETMEKLQDETRRPQEQLRSFTEEVRSAQPAEPVKLDKALFCSNVRVAPRSSSAALSGWRNEHWRVLLDEEYTTDLLYLVAAHVAKAEVPQGLGRALTTGSMVALQKDDKGVRTSSQARRCDDWWHAFWYNSTAKR